ncbi:hypothetical protein [Kordiimonas sp.]|uniref:hypothetical protein n=1 Tax=Kordiimonas sp. TaxID=1970157 RepID=UPI003A8F6914
MTLPPEHKIDRFRGWALTALYGSITLLSAMLILAAYMVWPAFEGDSMLVLGTGLMGLATALFGLRVTLEYVRAMRGHSGLPKLALMPFIFMAMTMIAASQLFGGH